MSLVGLLTQTAKVFRRSSGPTTDRYGRPSKVEAVGFDYPGLLQPVSAAEASVDRNMQIGDEWLFLPPDAAVSGVDRVEVDGDPYEVIGPPMRQRSPRGVHHLQLHVRVVTG